MAERYEYLNRCIAAMGSLDTAELRGKRAGVELGCGSGYAVHALGNIAVGGQIRHAALKIPLNDAKPDSRLRTEVTAATLLTGRVPELLPKMPVFIGLVAVSGQPENKALLVEDVTCGGTMTLYQGALDTTAARLAREAFPGIERGGLSDTALHRSVAFVVDGEERWLDLELSGSDFRAAREEWRDTLLQVNESMDQLTCIIPADSPLAESIITPP